MKKGVVAIILLIFSMLLVSAGELEERIIMEPINGWVLTDSSEASEGYVPGVGGGVLHDRYVGIYEIQNPESDSGTTTMSVIVIRSKSSSFTPQYIFDRNEGTYGASGNVAYKMVSKEYDSNVGTYAPSGNVHWNSGEYYIVLGPGTIASGAVHDIGIVEDLILEYGEKYPSDIDMTKACYELGETESTTYCSKFGDWREQRAKQQPCQFGYECLDRVCEDFAGFKQCGRPSLFIRIMYWFQDLFN